VSPNAIRWFFEKRLRANGEDLGLPIHFGAFEADLEAGELRKHGLKIKLQDQPFQILAMLLERPGQVVTREELQKRLWPDDTFVDFDRGLNRAVNRLREALGDSADVPRFVETLPKRGYRFVAPVEGPAPQPEVREPQPETPQTSAPPQTRLWAVVIVIVLLTGASVTYYYTRRPAVLTERDTVVLADFDNRASDPAFDYTLKQALAIDLEQSPFLQIVGDQQVANTLRLMFRDPDQPLTEDTARTLCQRIGSKAVLAGSIASLGSEYVIGLRALNCETGDMIAQEQARADRKEEVLNALDKAASGLRRKLGESLASVRKYDRPFHEALSTASLEAFQAYANGERIVKRQGNFLAIPLMRRATELDPNFAYAHSALGLLYGTLGEAKLSAEYTGKAYALRESVSEWEKFFISVEYHLQVTGDVEEAARLGQVWSQNYPRERTAHNRLAYAYNQLGQLESSLAEMQQARRLGGDNPLDIAALARAYMVLDRLPEARMLVHDALASNSERVAFRQALYSLSFLDDDLKGMQEQADWALNKPVAELLLVLHSNTEAYFGHLGKARELSQRAEESTLRNDFRERTAFAAWYRGSTGSRVRQRRSGPRTGADCSCFRAWTRHSGAGGVCTGESRRYCAGPEAG
jgi:DNA-binding winged helix-turn-helix (wHTH) protein/Flp pilus assembly protein TadD